MTLEGRGGEGRGEEMRKEGSGGEGRGEERENDIGGEGRGEKMRKEGSEGRGGEDKENACWKGRYMIRGSK